MQIMVRGYTVRFFVIHQQRYFITKFHILFIFDLYFFAGQQRVEKLLYIRERDELMIIGLFECLRYCYEFLFTKFELYSYTSSTLRDCGILQYFLLFGLGMAL